MKKISTLMMFGLLIAGAGTFLLFFYQEINRRWAFVSGGEPFPLIGWAIIIVGSCWIGWKVANFVFKDK